MVVTCINLELPCELCQQTKIHQQKVIEFCQDIKDKNCYHYTDCAAFDQYMKQRIRCIGNLKDLIAECLMGIVQNSNH
jgi:hypothetical protein